MPTTNERTMNGYIADAMEKQAPRNYRVDAERQGQGRRGNTAPDIVVYMPYELRTIVETEYGSPAIADAKKRLGYEFKDYSLSMKSVLAVGIPEEIGEMSRREREAALMSDDAQFLMQVVTGKSEDDPDIEITPNNPVPVSLRDIVQYAWLAAIPEAYSAEIINAVVSDLQAATNELQQRLRLVSRGSQTSLIDRYGNHDSNERLDSVAGNVVGTLASMIQLHMNLMQWGNIEGVSDIGAPDLWQAVEPHGGLPDKIAAEWRKIENINYMPLSTIAAEMLEDSELGPRLGRTLRLVHDTMRQYIRAGVSATTNVVAEIWQALIPDRDQRAAYYTKPATAEILANLTTERLRSPSQARYNEVCAGTGTLARATEENIRFRHYAANDDDKESIHAERMERFLQLTDINPQSISVATANMASLEPETPFDNSAMFAITAEGGSLNFLSRTGVSNMDEGLIGQSGVNQAMLTLIPRTVDICNNNDPYFRPRGGATNPIDSSNMSRYKRYADRHLKGVVNGQAGLATFMHAIEHLFLKYGSPHGKVLPLTAARAETYRGFRKNIANEYNDVIAISTAAGDAASMSADTNIQEMLLIGTKHTPPSQTGGGQFGDRAVTCVNLTRTFRTKLEAKMFADAIRREISLSKRMGEIVVGEVVGTYYRMEDIGDGRPWATLGVSGDYTALTDMITRGKSWNPETGEITDFALPMTNLNCVSAKGPTHHLLGCLPNSRAPSGAFTMYPATHTTNRGNPSMWTHKATEHTTITGEPTHYGQPRGDVSEAVRMRATAGHFHLTRNLRMSAQAIAMAYTEQACMGGTAWNTLKTEQGVGEAITLFLNSTYGLMIRVGYGQSTIVGRSRIQIRAIDDHPIPDFTAETDAGERARSIAAQNFDRLRNLPLKRISLSVLDDNRKEIDRVVTLMLGMDWNDETKAMLDTWRRLMCLQPAVNANNKTTLKTLAAAGIQP